jgi:hypothetical protein
MSQKIKSEMISRRRAFSLLGLAALGFALPAEVLTASDAEAQPAAPQTGQPAAPPAAGTTGTKRRRKKRKKKGSAATEQQK